MAKQKNLEIIYGEVVLFSEDRIILVVTTSERKMKRITCNFSILKQKKKFLLLTKIKDDYYQVVINTEKGTLEEIRSKLPPFSLDFVESDPIAQARFIASQIMTRIEFVNLLEGKNLSKEINKELLQIFQKTQHQLRNE